VLAERGVVRPIDITWHHRDVAASIWSSVGLTKLDPSDFRHRSLLELNLDGELVAEVDNVPIDLKNLIAASFQLASKSGTHHALVTCYPNSNLFISTRAIPLQCPLLSPEPPRPVKGEKLSCR
jgi:hypothetical protein